MKQQSPAARIQPAMPPRGPAQAPQRQQPKPQPFDPSKFVTPSLPLDEVRDLKLAFDIFDDDGSGMLDPKEIKQAFHDLGFVGENKFVYQIMAELDQDYSGGIDFAEFIKLATAKISDKDSRKDIGRIFEVYDQSNIGKFSINDLRRVAQQLGEQISNQELNTIFARADLDKDGFITSEDFYNIMTRRVYWDD